MSCIIETNNLYEINNNWEIQYLPLVTVLVSFYTRLLLSLIKFVGIENTSIKARIISIQ